MKNESPIFKIVPCVSIIRAVAFFLGKSMFVIFFSCYFTEIPEVVMQKNKYLHSFPNKESETAEGLNILGRKGGLELIEGCLIEHKYFACKSTKFGRGGNLPSTLLH